MLRHCSPKAWNLGDGVSVLGIAGYWSSGIINLFLRMGSAVASRDDRVGLRYSG